MFGWPCQSISDFDPQGLPPTPDTGGNTLVTGNLFENVRIEVDDQTGLGKPILIDGNIMDNSTVEHKSGKLKTAAGA